MCVIDDSNEHMLTVWDWQKRSKVAEIKVISRIHISSILYIYVQNHYTDTHVVNCSKCLLSETAASSVFDIEKCEWKT